MRPNRPSLSRINGITLLRVYQNPFEIDYTENAATNMMFNEFEISTLRNMTLNYKKYIALFCFFVCLFLLIFLYSYECTHTEQSTSYRLKNIVCKL